MDPAQVWHLMNDPQLQEWGTVIPMHPGLVALVDTGDNNVHHPYTAYNQGWEAFNAGYPAEANPYAYNPATRWLADWWETGWMGMEEDDDEDFGVLVDDNDETRDDD